MPRAAGPAAPAGRRRCGEPAARRRSSWRRSRAERLAVETRGARHGARQRVGGHHLQGLEPGRPRCASPKASRCAAGDVLVELDGAQARADLAVAEAALDREPQPVRPQPRALHHARCCRSRSSSRSRRRSRPTRRASPRRARALADTVIRAPFAGRVGPAPRQRRQPGQPRHRHHDARRHEHDQARLHGSRDVPRPPCTPGLDDHRAQRRLPGRSLRRARWRASTRASIRPRARSPCARCVPNPAGLLKPGMFLTVRLARGATDALVVPEQALVPEQGDMFVFVVQGRHGREAAGPHRPAPRRRRADRRGARGRRARRDRRHAEAARRCRGAGRERAADAPPAAVPKP